MPQHPGLWLTQIRLNPSQTLLSDLDLFRLPDIANLPGGSGAIESQVVHLHFFAGGYSFFAAAADYQCGDFFGFSRDRSLDPEGRWAVISYTRLLGIRIPLKVDGTDVLLPLERDRYFHSIQLRNALKL